MRVAEKDTWCDKCFDASSKVVHAYAKITKEDCHGRYSEHVCLKHLRGWRFPFSVYGDDTGKFGILLYNKIVIERIR